MIRRRHLLPAALFTVLVLVVAHWALGKLPDITRSRLPGAAGGSDTYTVRAYFTDVLDLVPNSTVQLDNVPVGRVTGIRATPGGPDGYRAMVRLQINHRFRLPGNTMATIRSTSLLGEKYVALLPPRHGHGSLGAGGTIPLARTGDDVEVEQVLGSLGAVLNGAGLENIASISRELSTALSGHEGDTRRLIRNLADILDRLNRGRPALVAALHSTARLSRVLAAQHQVLGRAVDDLDPATGVLARQQHRLTSALRSLDALSQHGERVVRSSTRATVTDLEELQRLAGHVSKVAGKIPPNLSVLLTYPFADNAVRAFSGVYGAIRGNVVVDLPMLLRAVAPIPAPSTPEPARPTRKQPSSPRRQPMPRQGTSPPVPGLPGGAGPGGSHGLLPHLKDVAP